MAGTAAPTTPELIFGKYSIIRRLAVGGMGEVFLARQSGVAGFDRLVILKSLLPELAAQDDFVEQFLDEARVAATLNHPNIVQIFEVGLWEGVYFIAMEYIRGENLARITKAAAKQGVRVPLAAAVRILHDACSGLDHAHAAKDLQGGVLGIVHRDVSPQNIMVRGDGVTKVVDFGIAKATNRATVTATGTLKGKLQYMSPEQVEGRPLDGRCDQFSLGIVLWETCCERRLFAGASEIDTIQRVLSMPVPAPSTILPGFPADLERTILRMLERDPDRRFATLRDAARDLKTFLDESSRGFGESELARFVVSVVGEEIQDQTKDLKPTGENYFISLRRSGEPHDVERTGPTASIRPQAARQVRAGPAVAVGAIAAVSVAVLGWMVMAPGSAPPSIISPSISAPQPAPPDPPVLPPLAPTPTTDDRIAPAETRPRASRARDDRRPASKPQTEVKAEVKPAPPANEGFLTLQTTPQTTISIDGVSYGSTPMTKRTLPAGPHTLSLVNKAAGVYEQRRIEIAAGETLKLNLSLKGR